MKKTLFLCLICFMTIASAKAQFCDHLEPADSFSLSYPYPNIGVDWILKNLEIQDSSPEFKFVAITEEVVINEDNLHMSYALQTATDSLGRTDLAYIEYSDITKKKKVFKRNVSDEARMLIHTLFNNIVIDTHYNKEKPVLDDSLTYAAYKIYYFYVHNYYLETNFEKNYRRCGKTFSPTKGPILTEYIAICEKLIDYVKGERIHGSDWDEDNIGDDLTQRIVKLIKKTKP